MYHGCTPKIAAQHVWWDRFPEESERPGSGIDKTSFWNMVAFLVGALPQFVKLCAMHGIPGLQALATMYMVPFLIMEAFRLSAGRAGTVDLMPLPTLESVNEGFVCWIISFGEVLHLSFSYWALAGCGFVYIPYCLMKVPIVFLQLCLVILIWIPAGSLFILTRMVLVIFDVQMSDRGSHAPDNTAGYRSDREHDTITFPPALMTDLEYTLALCSLAVAVLSIFQFSRMPGVMIDYLYWHSNFLSAMVVLEGSFVFPIIISLTAIPFVLIRRSAAFAKAAGIYKLPRSLAFHTFCLPIVTLTSLLVYFIFQFDQTSTWKPTWTDKLG